jgi:hypothetical protein
MSDVQNKIPWLIDSMSDVQKNQGLLQCLQIELPMCADKKINYYINQCLKIKK